MIDNILARNWLGAFRQQPRISATSIHYIFHTLQKRAENFRERPVNAAESRIRVADSSAQDGVESRSVPRRGDLVLGRLGADVM